MLDSNHKYERVATTVLIGLAIAIAIPPMVAFAADDVAYYRVHESVCAVSRQRQQLPWHDAVTSDTGTALHPGLAFGIEVLQP